MGSLSFIAIVDFTEEAKFIYCSESVVDVLGYEPRELIGKPGMALAHPDEFPRVQKLHYTTIKEDGAATMVYMRMKHKDPKTGYVLCGITRTIVHNILVGSVSYACPTTAMHQAATAQEVRVISPEAQQYAFSRWSNPAFIETSTRPSSSRTGGWAARDSRDSTPADSETEGSTSTSSPRTRHSRTCSVELRRENLFTFERLPNQSLRTLFILDRFSAKCTILYCSNDLLVTSTEVVTRSFFDFVYEKDEETVRQWINQVKSWGVNDLGQPSDGGFGYGWFTLLTKGRDSSVGERIPEPTESVRGGRHRGRSGAHSKRNREQYARDLPQCIARTNSADRPAGQLPPILPPVDSGSPQVQVDAIFSAHSDGVMVVLRRSEQGDS